MAAATVQAQIGRGASVTWETAESGIKFNREDTVAGTTGPVPIPSSGPATYYSWIKNLCIAVTGAGTTTINNRRISMGSSPAAHLQLFWKMVAVASYAQAASGNMPANSGSDDATPATYTLMTTSPVQYDNASVATSGTGPNGGMTVLCLGVGSAYAGGPNSNTSLPNIVYTYDEM